MVYRLHNLSLLTLKSSGLSALLAVLQTWSIDPWGPQGPSEKREEGPQIKKNTTQILFAFCTVVTFAPMMQNNIETAAS